MFHSAVLKLTAWYLLIIVVISLFFSTALYRVSTAELSRGLQRQESRFRAPEIIDRIAGLDDLSQIRQDQVQESRTHILWTLMYFNVVVVVAGGVVSYVFARHTLKPIEASLEAQNAFTADASHELRTPLTAMKSEIEVAMRDENLSLQDAKKLLSSNLEEIDHLNALSSSLLQLAGQNTKLDPTVLQQCNMEEIIHRAIANTKKRAEEKHIRVDAEKIHAELEGDFFGLTDVVTILLDNALKYSPAQTTVRVSVQKEKRSLSIMVQDEGEGISEKDLPYIFDRFYRADRSRSKQKTEGYGLGLSIAKKIVALHHGKIEAISTQGKGSTFTVHLPYTQPKTPFTL